MLGIDNFSSSSRHGPQLIAMKAEAKKFKHDNFELFECSVCDYLPMFNYSNDYVHGSKYDVIYNLACPASPKRYQEIPIDTVLACTLGLKNVIDLARFYEVPIVHTSTSEVYGDPHEYPQRECYRGNVNCYGPRANYDEGKRAGEALCYDYLHKYGVDVRVVRIFNTYGKFMAKDDGRVVSNFVCQALEGKSLTVYGHGKQTRSFCYVDDMTLALVAMGELKTNPMTPINVGNPNEFTVLELAEMVIERLGGKIVYGEMPQDDPKVRCPSIVLAKRLLGWSPLIRLEEGLDATIAYFKDMMK